MFSLVRLQILKLNSSATSRLEVCRGLTIGVRKETESKSTTVEDGKDMPVSDMPNPFQREKAQCILCKFKIQPDYKNAKLLSQFVSPYTGRIYGRHISGLCAKQQKRVEEEIVKSQNAGYMAYYLKQVEFLKDPKLFDPERPLRSHRF